MTTINLFDAEPLCGENISTHALILRNFALDGMPELLNALRSVLRAAPFRAIITPGGHSMSVKLSGCGTLGWVSDANGYRYSAFNPDTGKPWPAMPAALEALATQAAQAAGFNQFKPDACLINRYVAGSRMGLHQDKNERDFSAPIVSVSLGLPALFLFGGLQRSDRPARVPVFHGDVVVWGGPDRLKFHGVAPLKPGQHPLMGPQRINLTFRKAGSAA
jgi:alkylated DNA repair protein (DNA oxidative demethylase)